MESEKERAAFYQAHKDDPDVWGELEAAPATTSVPRTGLSVSIAVRFSPQEAEAIRRTARLEGKTYSEIVRKAVQVYTHPEYVFDPKRENVLPIFETSTPRTLASTLRVDFASPDRSRGTQTQSSAAELTTR